MNLRPSRAVLAVILACSVHLPFAAASTPALTARAPTAAAGRWPLIAFDDDFHSGLPGTFPSVKPTGASDTVTLAAYERPDTRDAIPPVLYEELDAAEKLMHKPVAYKSAAELDAYLSSVACALPASAYDRRGFLASLGLHGLLAPGRTDQPTLQAVEHLPNFRPGTIVNGQEIQAQVAVFRFAMAHPDVFLDLTQVANPIIESHSLQAALWKQRFEPAQEAHPTGETVVQRYAAAIARMPEFVFEAAFRAAFDAQPTGQPGYGTYTIAQNLGFTQDEARRLALNDDAVDYDTTPYGHTSYAPTDQMDRHFNLDPKHQDTRLVWASRHLSAAEIFARESAFDEAEVELGVGLHSLQDCFAHGQLTPCVHGVIGEFPDDVTDDPIAFYEATLATEAYLWAYLRAIAPEDAPTLTIGPSSSATGARTAS
ncbi:MAG TPA: hypothetical protein V6D47_08485 [Oscillatoriaceae cyanobacterium]